MSRGNTILSMFAVIALSVLGVILARSIPDAVFPEFVFHRAIILADNAALPAGQRDGSKLRKYKWSRVRRPRTG